ncbi:unnamed protein product [Acanthoscelides obtectus]|uniref:Uncharacterized protein n=1 Tax=Acanthoscelides obtectus TaxID=200917 RepID=A0A9P0M6I7_ACAOB|nr:unnamed protein product [Acanthoscelides obtectus]CAK1638933.1 hypothetical protein AOBTE_LOCUS10893 [Acanthoscelides obtectus]
MNIDSYRTIIYCGTNDTLQAYKHIRISYKYYRNGYLLRWCEHVLESCSSFIRYQGRSTLSLLFIYKR